MQNHEISTVMFIGPDGRGNETPADFRLLDELGCNGGQICVRLCLGMSGQLPSNIRHVQFPQSVTAAPPQHVPSFPNRLPRLVPSAPQSSPQQPSVPSSDSRITAVFPEIFAEFRTKPISLLWRGSRDGFKAKEFHRPCDGHANTLTVILDTEGNIFGGFTPVK
jgi:hypothetical protein